MAGKPKYILDPKKLRDRLCYDPYRGDLIWKDIEPINGESKANIARRNARRTGKIAGTKRGAKSRNPYLAVSIDGEQYLAHRVAWAIMTGNNPPDCIDHINGNGLDNRWENLRDGTGGENERNARKSISNTSGVTGVTWNKSRSKWQCSIQHNGKVIYIGLFDSLSCAAIARKEMEIQLGFPQERKEGTS